MPISLKNYSNLFFFMRKNQWEKRIVIEAMEKKFKLVVGVGVFAGLEKVIIFVGDVTAPCDSISFFYSVSCLFFLLPGLASREVQCIFIPLEYFWVLLTKGKILMMETTMDILSLSLRK